MTNFDDFCRVAQNLMDMLTCVRWRYMGVKNVINGQTNGKVFLGTQVSLRATTSSLQPLRTSFTLSIAKVTQNLTHMLTRLL